MNKKFWKQFAIALLVFLAGYASFDHRWMHIFSAPVTAPSVSGAPAT
ncbi:MAG: hypothetical protein M3N23_02365 [Pseudomonadota bacterium]|nr:hypothetical protein [Pseudomonadota bacterium]